VTDYGSHDLIEAAAAGDVVRVKALLDLGVSPNVQHAIHRGTPLTSAAVCGHLELVRVLVERGAEINMCAGEVSETALVKAAVAGRVDVVEWLLQAGARVPVGSEFEQLLVDLAGFEEYRIAAMIEATAVPPKAD